MLNIRIDNVLRLATQNWDDYERPIMPPGSKFYGERLLFGTKVILEADDADMLAAALAALGLCEGRAEQSVYVVLERCAPEIADHHDVEGAQFRMARNGIAIRADGAMGRGRCLYPTDCVPGEQLGEMILSAALFLVSQAGRVPLHASAVMAGDTAIVLAGRSGAGKSSLALAADRKGLAVLSDDTVYVQTEPRFRLWTLPSAIHLFEKDAPCGAVGGLRYRSGRWKRALPIRAPRQHAERALLCVLELAERVSLARMPVGDAVDALTRNAEPGYDLFGGRSAAAVLAIAAGGCWRLTLSHDPDAAIAVLQEAFGDAANASVATA